MKDMIKAMVQEMVMQSIKEVMTEMMGSSMDVAKAEVKPEPATKSVGLSREDFLAKEDFDTTQKTISEPEKPIDFEVLQDRNTLVFNQRVSKDLWTVNYLALKAKYPAVKYDKNTHGFHWNKADKSEFVACCRSYQVITSLDDSQKKAVEQYYKDRAAKRAEYYAKLAK